MACARARGWRLASAAPSSVPRPAAGASSPARPSSSEDLPAPFGPTIAVICPGASCAESPVHRNYKQAIVDADDTGTVMLNRKSPPCVRALKTERTAEIEREGSFDRSIFGSVKDVYFGGDMEAAVALSGQVAGRIDFVKPAKQIIDEVMDEFYAVINDLRRDYL